LIDVAQDDALASGIVDLLEDNGFLVFGPRKSAARIEWDKRWSREFMQRNNIPQPEFEYFDDEESAKMYAEKLHENNPSRLLYTKATGLCSGKGALKSTSLDKIISNIDLMKTFSNGGRLFSIVASGDTILEARQKAYSAMGHINIQGNNLHYRTDIGWRDVERFLKESL